MAEFDHENQLAAQSFIRRPGWLRAWIVLILPPISLVAFSTAAAVYAVHAAGDDRSVIGPTLSAWAPYILFVNHGFLYALMLILMLEGRP